MCFEVRLMDQEEQTELVTEGLVHHPLNELIVNCFCCGSIVFLFCGISY